MRRLYTLLLIVSCLLGIKPVLSAQVPSKAIGNHEDWKIGNPHTATWRLIDSLIKKGDTKVPSRMVDSLYELSLSNRDPIQIVKAVTRQQKFIMQADKSGFAKALRTLEKQIDEAPFIAKQMLLLLLSERYKMVYYGYGLDLFYEIKDTPGDSLQRKGLKEASEISNLYDEALNDEHNKAIPIDILKDLFEDTELPDYLQGATLYDYLAWQKLNYLQNDRVYWSITNYDMGIEDEMAFASAEAFAAHSFDPNKPSTFYKAIAFYQDLTKQYLEQSNQLMRQDLDLRRIGFVYDYAKMKNRDALYEAAIKREMKRLEQDSVYAEWAYLLANYHYDLGSAYNNKQKKGPNRFEWRTAYDIVETAIKKFPMSRGGLYCQNLKAVIKSVNLDLTAEEVYPLDKPMLVHLSYRNAPKVYCRLLHAAEAQSTIVTDRYYELYYLTSDSMRQVLNKALFSLSNVESWSLNLASDEDCRQHDTEIKINAQAKAGLYVLAISLDSMFQESSFIQYASFSLSNLAYNYCDNNANLNLQVYNRSSGKPLSDVEVTLYEDEAFRNIAFGDKEVILNRLRSNGKGLLSIKIGHEDFDLRLSKGADYLNLYKQEKDIYSYEKNVGMYQTVLFFLDRTIYRPGQTLYFKGLAIKQDVFGHRSKVLPGTKHKITLYDASNREVSTQWFKANEYGTFNGEFKLPATGRLGEMSLREGDSYYDSSISFRVEEYKRPKFDVTCEVQKELHLVNQAVKVKGKAMAFAGSSIDGAKVSYTISRKVESAYWYDWYWDKHYNNVTITSRETTSSTDGSFEFDFIASPDSSIERKMLPRFIYTIKVDVTDIAGETHSSQCQVTVAYHSFVLDLDIKNNQDVNDLKSAKISTRNLNGEPIFAQGTVFIEELESPKRIFKERLWKAEVLDQVTMSEAEFKANFPTVLYGNEDKLDNWKVKRVLANTSFDTKQSDALKLDANLTITAGIYRITLMSKDADGDTIKVVKYTRCYDLENKTMPAGVPLIVKTDKGTYEPGEKAIVYIGSSFEEAYAFYSLENEGILIMQGVVELKGMTTITIPVLEKYRGNVFLSVVLSNDNRTYSEGIKINVPFTNKKLKIEYTTFRDKLLPGQDEEWQVKISGPDGDKIAAEVLANMYDASLDELAAHKWNTQLYYYNRLDAKWRNENSRKGYAFSHHKPLTIYLEEAKREYPLIKEYDIYLLMSKFTGAYRSRGAGVHQADEGVAVYHSGSRRYARSRRLANMEDDVYVDGVRVRGSVSYDDESLILRDVEVGNVALAKRRQSLDRRVADIDTPIEDIEQQPETFDNVNVRTNLNETVFFEPDLMTDKDGNVIIKFKMNEALTRWKLMLLAVTKDLKIGYSERFVVTQKDLMITPNAPRFFRENDVIEFSAKVDNMTNAILKGEVKLELYDALTMQPIDALLGNNQAVVSFEAQAGQSAPLRWQLKIPNDESGTVTYRVMAKAGNFSDGEESTLPIISDRMFLTETFPLTVRGSQTKVFNFKQIAEVRQSKTAKIEKLTLEFTGNPTWLAIQSMSYLMQYPHECTEQLFSRFYGNIMAYSIIATHPKIKQVFDTWKKDGESAFTANLLKSPELRLALIEETPWILASKDEKIQKKQLGLLFDLGRMGDELELTIDKLAKRQNPTGGFAWYPGMGDDAYITCHVIEGFGRLNHLGVKVFTEYPKTQALIRNAIKYADDLILLSYKDLKTQNKLNQNNLDWTILEYLYARSFYLFNTSGNLYAPLEGEIKVAYGYYLDQAVEYSSNKGLYAEGLVAVALHRAGRKEAAQDIVKAFRNSATVDEDFGMYWKLQSGFYWYQSNIEAHVLMLEVFDEVAKDAQVVEAIKIYLLKSRQGSSWHTTKSTSAAIYALLLRGDDWLEEGRDVKITLGNTVLDQSKIKKEAGTGYFKTSWNAAEVKPEMANITVENPNKNIAWGAMYWQYFEDYDKVTSFRETPLKLSKQLYRRVNRDDGVDYKLVTDTTILRVGDLVEVRISLEATQDMEYVHLKDMRAACFEPLNVLSAYKYQDGLGYYESTRDLNTSFFMGTLHKGKYAFKYPLRVTHRGNFSNGISTIQSMYAPDYTSHSEGVRITVK